MSLTAGTSSSCLCRYACSRSFWTDLDLPFSWPFHVCKERRVNAFSLNEMYIFDEDNKSKGIEAREMESDCA